MSGRKVSVIVQYGVDADRNLVLSREVYWPTLRTAPRPGEPDWHKYRAYLKRKYGAETGPQVRINGKPLTRARSIYRIKRRTDHPPGRRAGRGPEAHPLPLPSAGAVLESWELTNTGKTSLRVAVAPLRQTEKAAGIYGTYALEAYVAPVSERRCHPAKK
jgi:hypothetical protein